MPTAPTTHHSRLGRSTLAQLEPALPAGDVLSIVLNVNPGSAANQGGSLHLRAHQLLHAAGAPAELATAVMDDLDDAQRHTRTRLSFLWDNHGHVQRQTVDTQLQLDETSRYGPPDLEPLRFALESSARVLLAVVDDAHGRLLSVHLGEITELYRLENVLTADDTFRVHSLPPADGGPGAAGRAPGTAPVQHQSAQQDARFHHALIAQVERLHEVGAFEQLLIGGAGRARAALHAQLSPSLRGVVAGEFAAPGDATPAALHAAAQAALSVLEDGLDIAVLDEVRDRGVQGTGPTLAATQDRRVSQLLVSAAGAAQPVWQDAAGHLTPAPDGGVTAPPDGVTARTVRDVLPLLRERYGVHVRFLSGARARQLDAQLGGLAGVLRY